MRRVAVIALAIVLAGCFGTLRAARPPANLLSTNGWTQDAASSDATPTSTDFGLSQTQTFVYEDDGGSGGYAASLALTTLKTLATPSAETLRDRVREIVRERAGQMGVSLDATDEDGRRTLASGDESLFFLFRGKVQAAGDLFTEDADVRIVGEVWNCKASATSVAGVGLAQINSVTRIGGVAVKTEEDDRNWREIVQDPRGSIQGITGNLGLLYNVAC